MTDALLTRNDQAEALSRAYVQAVAAGAGYTTASRDFDRDGVDLQVHAGGDMRPTLDLQLKATGNLRDGDIAYRFPLKRNNYDLLRIDARTPRLLVVLELPQDEDRWMTISPKKLVMRRCAYWVNLRDSPSSDNVSTITIDVPRANVLDVASLRRLMDHARTGTIPRGGTAS